MAVLALSGALLLPAVASPEDGATVPFRVHPTRGALLVTVTVNGHPGTWFVDTGAAVTVVDAKAAGPEAEHAFRKAAFERQGPGFTGQGVVVAVDLSFAGREWKDRHVAAMDLGDVSRVYGQRVDGILGMDILREWKGVTIDFAESRLVLR